MATAAILAPRGKFPNTGPEKGPAVPPRNSIARYTDPYGSTRYVLYEEGVAVAGLQVMSRDGINAVAANVYVVPERRRQGLATTLLERARDDFETLIPSSDLTDDGRAWTASWKNTPTPTVLTSSLQIDWRAGRIAGVMVAAFPAVGKKKISNQIWRHIIPGDDPTESFFYLRRDITNVATIELEFVNEEVRIIGLKRISGKLSETDFGQLRWFFESIDTRFTYNQWTEQQKARMFKRILRAEPVTPIRRMLAEDEMAVFDLLSERPPFLWGSDAFLAWVTERLDAEGGP